MTLKTAHPKGLYVLFFTEMWERFSYYGMRALLVLYMTQYLLLDPERARSVLGYTQLEQILFRIFGDMNVQAMSSQIYGLYTGFVYLTPLFGGILADRWIGQHKSVYVGGFLMAIGHFLMAIESMFLLALLFLILGNGCFKPNISTQVGDLYEDGDPRRDSAFAIFYMGINLGAFFSPLVCGTLGQKVGWHWGFGAAGIGMLVGLAVYHFGRHLVPRKAPAHQLALAQNGGQKESLTPEEWRRVGALALLCFLNIVFWGIYEQQGNTLQIWADEQIDWNFWFFTIPSTWYQSFNPAIIFLFTPILASFWAWQAGRKKEPSTIMKMGIGSLLCGLGYVIMIFAAKAIGDGKGSMFWLLSTTWMFTIGELYLSPIGLSYVTKVAPRRMISTMMGLWFLSSFFGNYASGFIGTFYTKMPKENFFLLLTVLGVGTAFLFFLVSRPVTRAIGREV